jgi:hypothetical protein
VARAGLNCGVGVGRDRRHPSHQRPRPPPSTATDGRWWDLDRLGACAEAPIGTGGAAAETCRVRFERSREGRRAASAAHPATRETIEDRPPGRPEITPAASTEAPLGIDAKGGFVSVGLQRRRPGIPQRLA